MKAKNRGVSVKRKETVMEEREKRKKRKQMELIFKRERWTKEKPVTRSCGEREEKNLRDARKGKKCERKRNNREEVKKQRDAKNKAGGKTQKGQKEKKKNVRQCGYIRLSGTSESAGGRKI